jgi:hypothetical protein
MDKVKIFYIAGPTGIRSIRLKLTPNRAVLLDGNPPGFRKRIHADDLKRLSYSEVAAAQKYVTGAEVKVKLIQERLAEAREELHKAKELFKATLKTKVANTK